MTAMFLNITLKTAILPSLIRICGKRYSLRWSAGGIMPCGTPFRSLNTRQPAIPLQAESSAVLAARFLAERYGTPPTKGLEESSGDATANIRQKAKRAVKVGILTMGFYIRLLLMYLIRWLKTRIIFSTNGKS